MENRIEAEKDYKLYTAKYGLISTRKETYRPPTS
jgi:hypothetical protein